LQDAASLPWSNAPENTHTMYYKAIWLAMHVSHKANSPMHIFLHHNNCSPIQIGFKWSLYILQLMRTDLSRALWMGRCCIRFRLINDVQIF
jgi:hypothetical protein